MYTTHAAVFALFPSVFGLQNVCSNKMESIKEKAVDRVLFQYYFKVLYCEYIKNGATPWIFSVGCDHNFSGQLLNKAALNDCFY